MSDIEKAIKNIKKQYKGIDYTSGKDITVLCIYDKQAEATIKALEKQLPQKGIPLNSAKNHNFVECGVCNKDMGMYYQYCPHCGQKIKWS